MNYNKILITFILVLFSGNVFSNNTDIAMKNEGMPSNDLLHPSLGVLNPEEAQRLQLDTRNPVDLSLLDPIENDVWKNSIGKEYEAQLDTIGEIENKEFNFSGILLSRSEMFRFTASSDNQSDNQIYQFLLHKNVHLYLLRKNLLRKLGYIVPAMKHMKKLTLNFNNLEELEQFLKRDIPENTLGSPWRWINKETIAEAKKTLKLIVHDVVVMAPSVQDHYNLSLGAPPRNLNARVLRSLLLPFSLVNFNESVNKVQWSMGRVKNEKINLAHDEITNFNITYDDALWMARRVSKLTRYDFAEIIINSHYPRAVSQLLVEKIISRRNSLMDLFNIDEGKLAYNSKVSFGKDLVKGKLLTDKYPYYASNFSHGIPDSPFKDFQYYVFSKIQSELLINLISKTNKALEIFDIPAARTKYHRNLFQSGLEHFIKTGEFQKIGVGFWWTPLINGRLILSRDIVIGNTFGTDNLIQTADTIGVAVSLGAHLGVEGIYKGIQLYANANLSLLRTYTHLRPVKTLKESVKEPYRNLIVPMLMYRLGKKFSKIGNTEEDKEKKDEELTELMGFVSENLAVGESFIITDKLTKNALVKAKATFKGLGAGVGLGANGAVIRRIQIFRKDQNTIQVYDDSGKIGSLLISFELDAYIPVLSMTFKGSKGSYSSKIFNISIDKDLEENPSFYENAFSLAKLFKTGSTELLDASNPAYIIKNKFTDKSFNLSLLFFKRKSLDSVSKFQLISPKGHQSYYLNISDGLQKGKNYESFVREVIGYYLGMFFDDAKISSSKWKNPAHTLFGDSITKSRRFEGKISKDKKYLSKSFIAVEKKWEGWSIKRKKLIKRVNEINKYYGREIFSPKILQDTKTIRLYEIALITHFYEKAIENISKLSLETVQNIEYKYISRNQSKPECRKKATKGPRSKGGKSIKITRCGYLNDLKRAIKKCDFILKNDESTLVGNSRCLLKIAKHMEDDLDFSDFLKLLGEDNVFITGKINGFRSKSEILMEPILSNTIGSISSRHVNGPISQLKKKLGMQTGEFYGYWLRESLR